MDLMIVYLWFVQDAIKFYFINIIKIQYHCQVPLFDATMCVRME